jgi:hypothetical protein
VSCSSRFGLAPTPLSEFPYPSFFGSTFALSCRSETSVLSLPPVNQDFASSSIVSVVIQERAPLSHLRVIPLSVVLDVSLGEARSAKPLLVLHMHKSYIPSGAIQRNSSTRPKCQDINMREPCCRRESLCTKTQMGFCSFVRKPLLVNARARILTSKVAIILKVVQSMTFPVLALCVTVQQKNTSLAQSARIAKHAAHHRPFAVW